MTVLAPVPIPTVTFTPRPLELSRPASNLGGAIARVKREILAANLKYRRQNGRNSTIDWTAVIEKQTDDLKAALQKRADHPSAATYGIKHTAAIRKELAQVATAALLALAAIEDEEGETS